MNYGRNMLVGMFLPFFILKKHLFLDPFLTKKQKNIVQFVKNAYYIFQKNMV